MVSITSKRRTGSFLSRETSAVLETVQAQSRLLGIRLNKPVDVGIAAAIRNAQLELLIIAKPKPRPPHTQRRESKRGVLKENEIKAN